jgi:radical SAM protein
MGEPVQTSRADVGRGPVQDRAPTAASAAHGTAQTGLRRLRFDVGSRPFLVLVELTRACELACRHCRAEANRERDPDELTTTEIAAILDDLGSLGSPRPIVVFTGGDPLMRPDLVELVRHGVDAQLAVAVAPAGTPRAAPAVLGELRRAGVSTVSFSLDGASPSTHDGFRLTQGSFNWTVAACTAARRAGLRLQLNTTVTEETAHELPEVLDLARRLGVGLWSVFFLVPMGRGKALRPLSAEGIEDVLEFLFEAAAVIPLKTTEAPQYRRIVLRHGSGAPTGTAERGALYAELHDRLGGLGIPLRVRAEAGITAASGAGHRRPPLVVGDGQGVVFISSRGDVQPSGFLPLVAGNVRDRPLAEIYADSGLFRSLRDPEQLRGRCGRCEYRDSCGGSRARAFATNGDPLAEDPGCPYEPGSTAVLEPAGTPRSRRAATGLRS